jgi:hypothetical protein
MTAASSSSGFVPKTDSNFSSASSYLAFLQPIFRKIVHIVLPYSALDKFQSQKQHCRCSTFWFGHISPYIQILWIKHTVHCFTFELQIYKMTSHLMYIDLYHVCLSYFEVLKLYSKRRIQRIKVIFEEVILHRNINATSKSTFICSTLTK